jgi:hypothetical protein
MVSRKCAACGQWFHPRAQCPGQTYCADPACQRARRRRWQAQKRQTDAAYRENQAQAQRAWAARHPGYWRTYRGQHPEVLARNRTLQGDRDRRRGELAKMDASTPVLLFPSGTYRLQSVTPGGLAKSDAWTVEIRVVTAT